MKSKPLVSVFITVYNAEKYISEALESILMQTYSNLEIIVVNDGSTDNSLEIINSYEDKRIKVINNKENKGIPFSRNLGLKNANGKYLVIMDADDISTPNRIEKQVEFMEKNPNIVASGTFYQYLGKTFSRKIKSKYIEPEQLKIQVLFSSPIANPTAIIRMDIIRKYNFLYNECYFVAQDYDMWVQLSKVGDLAILPEVLFKYRIGHNNISKLSRTQRAKERKKIIDTIHSDILNFYGFKLTFREKELYNHLFSDNPVDFSDLMINNIPHLIKKLELENEQKNIFEKSLFRRVLFDHVLISIGNSNLNIMDQIRLIIKIDEILSIRKKKKSLLYLVAKRLYKSCLSSSKLI